jgi:hypothetical protein
VCRLIVVLNVLLSYLLHGAVPLEKLTGSRLVKKFPSFYGTRRFITAFTSPRHLSVSWARSIQSLPPHSASWRYIVILSSHLRLGLFKWSHSLTSSLRPPKPCITPFLSPRRAPCPAHLILLVLIKRIIFREQFTSFLSSHYVRSFLHSPETEGFVVVNVPKQDLIW